MFNIKISNLFLKQDFEIFWSIFISAFSTLLQLFAAFEQKAFITMHEEIDMTPKLFILIYLF